jgi:sodium pump decarboxylase gamma subunit
LELDTVTQGLAITVGGMTLVFLALGLIVLAMVWMGRFLRPRPKIEDETSEPAPERQQRARVAAMAAAIFIGQHRAELPDGGAWHTVPSQAGAPSPWLASHRARALAWRPQITKGKG